MVFKSNPNQRQSGTRGITVKKIVNKIQTAMQLAADVLPLELSLIWLK